MRTVLPFSVILYLVKQFSVQARMTQLQDAQKGAEVTSEVTERELELEAQLVEARSIIQEQVCAV
jgi:X breakpoint 2-interacting protein